MPERRRLLALALLALAGVATGCRTTAEHVGIALFYREAPLPPEQMMLDVPYRDGPDAHPDKHRLDLFLPGPDARDWPTLVFIHGGGWTYGDRALEAGGAEVMRNIGRYFASQGVGAAVISYRLQPEVTWREQVRDVADAVGFVRARVPALGGHPDALYLSGHSAGAWLAAKTGFDAALLDAAGVPASSLCGFALVSGAAYDLGDEETYDLGASRGYFVRRFDDGSADWERAASVTPLLRPSLPATLVLYGSWESDQLRRQSDLLYDTLAETGAPAERVVVPREGHESIVLTLSRGDKTSASAMLELIDTAPCPARRRPEPVVNRRP